jgi:nucleoside permease NupC
MILTGFIVFAATAALLAKLRRNWLLSALHHGVAIDLVVTAVTLAVHWGTFSGVMAATVAGLLTSLATSAAKQVFGYIQRGVYYPGLVAVNPRG